jgi:hypothetical protein
MRAVYRARFPCLKPETYRESCILQAVICSKMTGQNYRQGCDYSPPFQTLNILARNLLLPNGNEERCHLGGAQWLNARKRIDANCVLL